MENATDVGHQITAHKIMENMLYDNGCINRNEADSLNRYPKKHFEAITAGCDIFFTAHPDLLTDDNLDEIACGDWDENNAKYRVHTEFKPLDDACEAFFDAM